MTRNPPKPAATFEVTFKRPGIVPEQIPVRAVSEALSAVQDLASGRDPFISAKVDPEETIGLLNVRRGSAVFLCVAKKPKEAIANLRQMGKLLDEPDQTDGDRLAAALPAVDTLSTIARTLDCTVSIREATSRNGSLLTVTGSSFEQISSRVLLRGDTTIFGRVERVGGSTGTRCALRLPVRRHILYCDVESRELARRLGQHLYENIAAVGTAVWVHRSWHVYSFTVRDFYQPDLGEPGKIIQALRDAGLKAWDEVEDPDALLREIRQ